MSGTVLKQLSPKEIGEFYVTLGQQVPTKLFEHPEIVRRYLRSKRELGKALHEMLLAKVSGLNLDHQLEFWQRVYWEVTGLEPGFSDIALPEDLGGFGWTVASTPEVSLNTFFTGLKRKFNCWSQCGNNLEESLDWNRQERSYRNGEYAIRLRDRVEADEENANLSANTIAERSLTTITLDERIRLEGFYWVLSSGQHLDVENITLCTGSRDSGGTVPGVYWGPGSRKLCINWCDPDRSRPRLRARSVVS